MSNIDWNDPKSVGRGVLTAQLLKDTLAKLDQVYPSIDSLIIEMEDGKMIGPCECMSTMADKNSPIVLEVTVPPLATAIGKLQCMKLHDTSGSRNYNGLWMPTKNYPIGSTHIKVALATEARSL